MDKFEYRIKTEQMVKYLEEKSYRKAMEIADSINWKKVASVSMLSLVSEVYEGNREYQKSRDVLFMAYDRAPGSKKIIYRLGETAVLLGDAAEAADSYEEFCRVAPKDPNQYILRYQVLKLQRAPRKEQIEALEMLKKAEYIEKWAYELAKLYHEAGMKKECIEECDDLALWFSEGKYVYRAMELKMRYKPLTPMQQERYEKQKSEIANNTIFKQPESPAKTVEKPLLRDTATVEISLADLHVEELAKNIKIEEPKLELGLESKIELEPKPEIGLELGLKPEIESEPKIELASEVQRAEELGDTKVISRDLVENALKVESIFMQPKEKEEEAMDREEQDLIATGQMKIDAILKEWETKQKENAALIQEKALEKQEKAPVLESATEKDSLVPNDIRELMESLENGTEEDLDDDHDIEEYEIDESELEEPIDHVGAIVDSLKIEDLDDVEYEVEDVKAESENAAQDDEEYDEDEEYDDEEYDEDEEYDDEEYDEYEEYDDEEYDEDEEYDDEEYDEDEEYDDEEYDEDEEYDNEEYDEDEEYDDEEYDEDEEYDDEEYDEDEEYDDEEYDEDEEYDDEEYDEDEEYDDEEYDEDEEHDDVDENEENDMESDEELDLEEEIDEIELPVETKTKKKENVSKGGVSFDTGFVVQGRYDLSATSEIGLQVGLTEEQKKLFSYFVPIRGVSEQIVDVLEHDKRGKKKNGTSKSGNILVVGRKGTGKTVLAVNIVKAIQKQRKAKQGRVAIVTGEALNKKELSGIIPKLNGGAIIIEKAGKLNTKTIRELNKLMEGKTNELLVILEEQRKDIEKMMTAHPEFKKKFTSRIELPVFINDELVTFGQTYAKEMGYRIDDMGILALYSRIDVMQREDHAVTVAEVKDILDDAISHSKKGNVKHLVKRVFGKNTDEGERVILTEEDFK